jgi:hypothetical protein
MMCAVAAAAFAPGVMRRDERQPARSGLSSTRKKGEPETVRRESVHAAREAYQATPRIWAEHVFVSRRSCEGVVDVKAFMCRRRNN